MKEQWYLRTDQKKVDHYYVVDKPRVFTTICGLIVNEDEDWFQFHASEHHDDKLMLLPPREGTWIKPNIYTKYDEVELCRDCVEIYPLLGILQELGE